MGSLLERVRQINQLVQHSADLTGDYSPMAERLAELIGGNIYLIESDGNLQGQALRDEPDCPQVVPGDEARLSPAFHQQLAFLLTPAVNIKLEDCFFHESGCNPASRTMTIIPIQSGGERLGTLLLTRREGQYTEDDLILAEVGATVLGMAFLRHRLERSQADARHKANVQIALDSLSFSEMEAITNVFDELGGTEGFLVASKIADRIGITRSVIVNAMRKLESAGVVESRSLGMKGTYIRVQNRFFLDELAKRGRPK
ncbi:MAG: GTP-sensing pleiotropic transcriptional regulator CodY [Bacteroidota bacterium]